MDVEGVTPAGEAADSGWGAGAAWQGLMGKG
jgi:hypothetical protein